MTAYGRMDKTRAGTKQGIDSTVKSRLAAEGIPLGVPVFAKKGDTETVALLNNDEATIAYSVDFILDNVIEVKVTNEREGEQVVNVAWDTDHATTFAAVVAAVDALDGIEAESEAANEITVQSDDGAAITVTSAVTGGASQPTVTITPGNSGEQVFAGASMKSDLEPALTAYRVTDAVNVMIQGWLSVQCATACVSGEKVYYDANGNFANAGTEIPGAYFEGNLSAAGVVDIRLNQ